MVVKNEREISKKMKVTLTTLSAKNKEIFKQSSSVDKVDGMLAVLEDGVQESRELFMEKTLVSEEIKSVMEKIVPAEKSKVHHMMKYLSLSSEDIEHKIGVKTRL